MAIKEPFTDLDINKQESGFYEGYSLPIALKSKAIMVALVLWAIIFPVSANGTLDDWNWALLQGFQCILHHFCGCICVLPVCPRHTAHGQAKTGWRRYSPRILQLLVVLNDVWRRAWCRAYGLCDGRATGAMGI